MPNITFLTTQSFSGSTNIGRIVPLIRNMPKSTEISLLVHASETTPKLPENCTVYVTGKDPFTRTPQGKKRLRGIPLVIRLGINTLRGLWTLVKIRPEILIVSKALPESVCVGWLYSMVYTKTTVIFDVDDFELTANKLSSEVERVAIHWAARTGANVADTIVVATPFLADHFKQLAQKKPVVCIPTGVEKSELIVPAAQPQHLIAYLGSISVSSGHRVDMLPEILRQVRSTLPDTKLLMLGSGDDIETLKTLFSEKGVADAVEWGGRFAPQDVPALLQSVSVIVDPIDGSITNRAKSSFRTMLAASSGIPIITSNIGIRAEIIPLDFHMKFFAAPENIEDYAKKITDVISHPLSEEDRQILRNHAMRYTWDNLAKDYQKLFV